MTLDLFAYAEEQAQAGMGLAEDHANAVHEGWSEQAYRTLVAFARRNVEFISEDVSDSTKDDPTFPQPPTDRAWGAVYRRAQKAGVIVRTSRVGRSRRRHNSICPLWQSLVFKGDAL